MYSLITRYFFVLFFSLVLGSCGGGGVDTASNSSAADQETGQTQETSSTSNLVEINDFANLQPPLATNDSLLSLDNFIGDYNRLAIEYFLSSSDNSPNIVTAPVSFLHVLGMLASGAAGETAIELQNGLATTVESSEWPTIVNALKQQLADTDSSTQVLTVKNALWGHTGYRFHISFLDGLRNYFQAELIPHDFTGLRFASLEKVYLWVKNNTDPVIDPKVDISSLPSPDWTRMSFANISKLNTKWETPFDSETFTGLFEDLEGERYNVPMVHAEGTFKTYQDDTVFAFEMPMAESNLSMLVLMPIGPKVWYESTSCGECVKQYEEGKYLTFKDDLLNNYSQIVNGLEAKFLEVDLPLFSVDLKNSMVPFLEGKNITKAFDGMLADFSGVNGLGYLFANSFEQYAAIKFSESGLITSGACTSVVEATKDEPEDVWDLGTGFIDISGFNDGWGFNDGSTGLVVYRVCITPPVCEQPPASHARPFIYVIRDTITNAILFIGSLTDVGGEPVVIN